MVTDADERFKEGCRSVNNNNNTYQMILQTTEGVAMEVEVKMKVKVKVKVEVEVEVDV